MAERISLRLVLPFLPVVVWATVLGALIAPIHPSLEERIGNRSVAAFVSALAAAVPVSVPLLFVVQQLARGAADGATCIEASYGL